MKSGRHYRITALALASLLALAGCGDTIRDIFGSTGAAKGSTTTGKRISVLESSRKIEPDKDLKDIKPQLPAPSVNLSWTQAGFDARHVMPAAALADHPEEAWSTSIGYGSGSDFQLLARPVIGDGTVIAMDSHGVITAFDAGDGDEKWEFDTTPPDRDDAMGGGLSMGGDTLYATTGFGEVLALKAADGALVWRRMLLNPIRGAPTIADGRVYVVSIDNELQALDVKNGDVLWHHRGISESAALMGASNPAVEADSVVAAYSSGEIFNLRPENGRAAWSYTLTVPTQVGALPAIADIRGLPVIDRGRVFAISHSGRIAAIDQRSGERAWEADIGGINTPLVAGDAVFALSNDSQLIALARDSGRIMWVKELQKLADPEDHDSGQVFWAGPILAGNRLWLTNSLGQLASFSPNDGAPVDSIDLSDPVFIPPVVAANTIYVVLDTGRLVALR